MKKGQIMNKYVKDALRLEKFIHDMLPLMAKPKEEVRINDFNLSNNFEQDENKKFDGVVYLQQTQEINCSFYNSDEEAAVLVPIDCLIFKNKTVQKKVEEFIKKYAKYYR